MPIIRGPESHKWAAFVGIAVMACGVVVPDSGLAMSLLVHGLGWLAIQVGLYLRVDWDDGPPSACLAAYGGITLLRVSGLVLMFIAPTSADTPEHGVPQVLDGFWRGVIGAAALGAGFAMWGVALRSEWDHLVDTWRG